MFVYRNADTSGGDVPQGSGLWEFLVSLVDQLETTDVEHGDVGIVELPAGWTVSAHAGGTVVLDNIYESTAGKHMHPVTRQHILDLWMRFIGGGVDAVRDEPWNDGYH